jgi:uncharacterized protein (UPF0303 family)
MDRSAQDKEISALQTQEKELWVPSFSNDDALALGNLIVRKVRESGRSVALEIERNGRVLFRYAMEGTGVDHDKWIARKRKTVILTEHSSLLIRLELERNGQNLAERYLVDGNEYVASGGGVPIKLKETGLVGTIVVSGLPDVDDHAVIIAALKEHYKLSIKL